jgi:hypothetical protein
MNQFLKNSIFFIFMLLIGFTQFHRPPGMNSCPHSNYQEEKLFLKCNSDATNHNTQTDECRTSFGSDKEDIQSNPIAVQFKKFHHKTLSILRLNDRNHSTCFPGIRYCQTANRFSDIQRISHDRTILSATEKRL